MALNQHVEIIHSNLSVTHWMIILYDAVDSSRLLMIDLLIEWHKILGTPYETMHNGTGHCTGLHNDIVSSLYMYL